MHSYLSYLPYQSSPAQETYRYYTSACCAGIFDTTRTPELIGPKAFARSTYVLHRIVMTLTHIGRAWLLCACLLCIRTAAVGLLFIITCVEQHRAPT